MKIVYCMVQCNIASGGIRVVFEHANRLAARGHNVEIWTLNPFNDELPFPITVPVKYVPCDFDNSRQKLIGFNPNSIQTLEPDIYVACSFPVAYGCNIFPKARSFWFMQHDETISFLDSASPTELAADTFEQALQLPLTILCNSSWVESEVHKKYQVQATVIPMGIDRTQFLPSRPSIDNGQHPTVLAIYNGQIWKGLKDLYYALALLSTIKPDLKLLLISALPIEDMISDEHVDVLLSPSQDALKHIYASADVFVSSSWAEGFGLPGLEALACGIPLVTTDSGGIREYAVSNETAVIVPPRDPRALAEGIAKALDDKDLRKRLIENGLVKASEFGWDKTIDKLEGIFSQQMSASHIGKTNE